MDTIAELAEALMARPTPVTEAEIEMYADDIVKIMSDKELSYDQSYRSLESICAVIKEAKYHLGHNAAMQLGEQPVKFALESY